MEMVKFMMLIMILLSGVMVQEAMGQDRNSCINRLLPCMNFFNGTRGDPPESCCNPLKDVIENMPECLCQMVSIKGSNAAEKAGININEAQMLPARCGQPVNYIGCLKGASDSDSNSAGYTSRVKMLLAVASLIFAQLL